MSEALRQKFTENAEQFDALMVEMLAENDRLRNALAEIERFGHNEGHWRDISTAPRDGQIVDLWHKKYGRMTDTWWDDCWVVTGTGDEDFSHWMPVPLAP